jgi:hypothetical protein
MKNFILSLIIIFVTCQALFAQELEGKQVTLRAFTSVTGKGFFMKTLCYKDSIKINCKIEDSVSVNKLKNDLVYKTLMNSFREVNQFDLTNDSLKNLLKRIDSVTVAYTTYSTDSVLIACSHFPDYSKLLGNLFKSSRIELENTEQNTPRVILDGTNMSFEFSQNELIQYSAGAHSPDKESHPLLYDYVKSTLDIYRRIKKDTFLTKEKTSGY